jgi:16S rRNA (guanine1516-N2)-methyltransferase
MRRSIPASDPSRSPSADSKLRKNAEVVQHPSIDRAPAGRPPVTRPDLAVYAAPPHCDAARAEATRIDLPFLESPDTAALTLVLDARGWALRDPAGVTVRCDLTEGELGRRLRAGRAGERRLATALGLRRHPAPLVLDATAGLGRESILAAALGCTVIACERSPAVALLLRDGLERAAAIPTLRDVVARIDLREADAPHLLAALPGDARPDVVLVDPMFPAASGSRALAKKEMQLLQRLLGEPEPGEDQALLNAALRYARRRVVVKRPPHAPVLGGEPNVSLPGRASRYDVYLVAPGGGAD